MMNEPKRLARRLANLLRSARCELGITQQQAAERARMSVEFYSRLERGRALPSLITTVRLAREFSISGDALLGTGTLHGGDRPDDARSLLRRDNAKNSNELNRSTDASGNDDPDR